MLRYLLMALGVLLAAGGTGEPSRVAVAESYPEAILTAPADGPVQAGQSEGVTGESRWHEAEAASDSPRDELPEHRDAPFGPAAPGPKAVGLLYTGCGGVEAPVVNAAFEQEVIERTNQERWNNGGLPPLKRVPGLDSAARYHATDMWQDNYFNHDSHDRVSGGLVVACSWAQRVGGYYGPYTTIGENIAAGYSSPQAAIAAWMASSGHRANILTQTAWEIGTGYSCCGGQYSRYWAQNFGRRSGVFPLIVNREAARTTSRSVSIYIYGSFAEVRLRNGAEAWSGWQSFSNNLVWTLPAVSGLHTVTAEMRSGGTVRTASDSIWLDFAGVPAPTASRTPLPTATRRLLPTATPRVPATATPRPVATATRVPPVGGETLSVPVAHDAFVYSGSPFYSYGYSTALAIFAGNHAYRTYLKFNVTGLSGMPSDARVRLYAYDGSVSGGSIWRVPNSYRASAVDWTEVGLTWSNAPDIAGTPLATLGRVAARSWVDYPIGRTIGGNGVYSFVLSSQSSDLAGFYSRQAARYRPELVIRR